MPKDEIALLGGVRVKAVDLEDGSYALRVDDAGAGSELLPERWYGLDGGAPANRVAGDTLTPFQADSGNNDYGTPIQILDTEDTPTIAGNTSFRIGRIIITAAERNNVYKLRFAFGASYAAAIAAGTYNEVMYNQLPGNGNTGPVDLRGQTYPVGTKGWVSVWCPDNTGTIDFFIGLTGT
jgi:hypothetical protein